MEKAMTDHERAREIIHKHIHECFPGIEAVHGSKCDLITNEVAAALSAARQEIGGRVATLFDSVKHGDDEHRAWLKKAIEDHFAGRPVDRPAGKNTAEAIAAARQEERTALQAELKAKDALISSMKAREKAGEAVAKQLENWIDRMLIGGNHLGLHHTEKWPKPETNPLDALEILGATKEYDIWCCWREIMLVSKQVERSATKDSKP